MNSEKLINEMDFFKLPNNITPEELEYALEIMDKTELKIEDEYTMSVDITSQHLLNYIINLKRNHSTFDCYTIEVEDIANMKIQPFIDSIYRFEILNDITPEERDYARKIMDRMNHDMKYVYPDDIPYSSDSVMNMIINIKRIADSFGI